MNGFSAALRKELLEQWRTHRFIVVAAVLVAFGLFSPLLAYLTPEIVTLVPGAEQLGALIPEPGVADAVDQYIKNLSQFGVILALLLGMGIIAKEKERGTAALMLVKPLSRGAFVGAKAAALALTFVCALALSALGGYYYTWVLFGPLSVLGWVVLNALLFAYLATYLAVALLASALGRSQVMAGGLAFGLFVLLGIVGALPGLGDYTPSRLLRWGREIALSGGSEGAWWALAVSLVLITCGVVGAWAAFSRQEP